MGKEDAVYFFTGEDESKKSLSIDRLKTKLSLTSESLDYNIYYGKDAAAPDIILGLETPPFSENKRLVILKEAEELSEDDKERLISYFKKPAKSSIFVITTQKDPDASDRLNIAAKRYAKCIDFPLLKEDKISVFRLVDEISQKREKLALQTLVLLMQSGKNAHEILGLIAWHIRRLGKVKVLLEEGKIKEEIAQSLKVSYYTAQNIIEQAKNFTLEEIKRAQQLLIETDVRLKKSISSPEVLLEMLIMRLTKMWSTPYFCQLN